MYFVLILVASLAGSISTFLSKRVFRDNVDFYFVESVVIGLFVTAFSHADWGWGIIYAVSSLLGSLVYLRISENTQNGITKEHIHSLWNAIGYASLFWYIAAPPRYIKDREDTAVVSTVTCIGISFASALFIASQANEHKFTIGMCLTILLYVVFNLLFKLSFEVSERILKRYDGLPDGFQKSKNDNRKYSRLLKENEKLVWNLGDEKPKNEDRN